MLVGLLPYTGRTVNHSFSTSCRSSPNYVPVKMLCIITLVNVLTIVQTYHVFTVSPDTVLP